MNHIYVGDLFFFLKMEKPKLRDEYIIKNKTSYYWGATKGSYGYGTSYHHNCNDNL